jgi:hypothetical protein
MKKHLLSIVAAGLLTSSTVPISAESSASVKRAAYVKATFDELILPVGGIALGAALMPLCTNPGLMPVMLSRVIAYGTGFGACALLGSKISAQYLKMHKLFGYTDEEIKEIAKLSALHSEHFFFGYVVPPIYLSYILIGKAFYCVKDYFKHKDA